MIEQEHRNDEAGNPAGGVTSAVGFVINWQDGPLRISELGDARREQTGAFVEDVILAAIGRIEYYQQSKFHCLHNAVALGHLMAAYQALLERTRDRTDRDVEGTHNR